MAMLNRLNPARTFIFTDRSKAILLWWFLLLYVLVLNFRAVNILCAFSYF